MEYRLKQKMQIRAKIQIVTKCDQIVLTTAWGAGNIFHLLCLWFCVSHPGAIFNLLNASGVGRVMSPLHCHPSSPPSPFEALRKCYITSCRKYRIKTGKCSNFEAQLDIFCDLKRIFKNGLFILNQMDDIDKPVLHPLLRRTLGSLILNL